MIGDSIEEFYMTLSGEGSSGLPVLLRHDRGSACSHHIENMAGGCSDHSGYETVPLRMPTYHFERLLEEACPNHTYPVKHKLKECDIMKNFMTSGFLT
jgi:hypothetical protein